MKSTEEIFELEKMLLKLENLHASFDYLSINIASPKRIRSWSQRILPNGAVIGEVLRPETINFRTHTPELYGLFCEVIFGPTKNWRCSCGKYVGFFSNKICEECDVEIIESRVRRYRMGYIELTCPIVHLWYLKGIPSYLLTLLKCYHKDLKISTLEDLIYFQAGDVIAHPRNPLYKFISIEEKEIENEKELEKDGKKQLFQNKNELEPFLFPEKIQKTFKTYKFKEHKRLGAEIIKAALEGLDIHEEIEKARAIIDDIPVKILNKSRVQDKDLVRRIRILESFFATKTNPAWMILTVLPVLPPNLRPLLELESGKLVAADINEIYRLIITRNQRLFDFLYHCVAPNIISYHARKLLQEAVDSLIDNARLPKEKIFFLNNKPLKSLTEILEGKQGRFRQSLLGKRVDYSGRSVIIVGPNLRLNQCGLPYEMAIELFQPFIINELLKTKIKAPNHNTKLAHVIIKKKKPFTWTLLALLAQKHAVLLNRAPTLHRFGIQAFDPVLVLGQAIHLHPLVCTGFNADFDGDQMAVHLPLYEVSQLEARTLMRPCYNVLSPSNGEVILKPTQDMVIGCYYLTMMIKKHPGLIKKWFSNETEALMAFHEKKVQIHTPILVRYSSGSFQIKSKNGELVFRDLFQFEEINEKILVIQKTFCFPLKNTKKYFLFTNLGILTLEKNHRDSFKILSFFLETTPGRLIFSTNFKNSITV